MSPLNVTMSAPSAMASRGVGSCGSPYASRSTSMPLPRSFEERQLVLVRDRRQFGFGHARGEAFDLVIARVHLHQRRGARVDCLLVIARMRAIGRADFFQFAACARHDVRNAERAADLDQLAARDDHFLFGRERVQDEIDRRSVVVHDDGGFGARQTAAASASTWLSRSPRAPPPRSNSRLTARVMAACAASAAASG